MSDALDRGRAAYARSSWLDARDALAAVDQAEPLGGTDLELLATATYMLGEESRYLELLERAHRAHEAAEDLPRAARAAFWIGVNLARAGEQAKAGGWLGRAARICERLEADAVEHGYLLIPRVFQLEASGELDAAAKLAGEASEIGERTGDLDLFALAAHEHGSIVIRAGRIDDGLGLLDEAMIAVTSGDPSPIVAGIVYCGVILACQEAHETRRAGEWTEALSAWCEAQPDLVAFTGRCLVHRAEILQLRGAWPKALGEAHRAAERSKASENETAAAEAAYRQGEIHRLLGELDQAEADYHAASQAGREPQPGLALLRLAQRRSEAAEKAIRRLLTETRGAADRAEILPAAVEVMVAVGDLESASECAEELERLNEAGTTEWLSAQALTARGSVFLADGDAAGALPLLRAAAGHWTDLQAPYERARVRALIGSACRLLGDSDGASLELGAAREELTALGARTDLERLTVLEGADSPGRHGLSPRELEVLRHLAAGETNKAIAGSLVLSVRTVDRHVSNILAKLGVATRTEAAAFAHEHDLT